MAEPYVTATADQQIESDQDPAEVEVVAQRYSWSFNYNDTGQETTASVPVTRLVLPADRPVVLHITSSD